MNPDELQALWDQPSPLGVDEASPATDTAEHAFDVLLQYLALRLEMYHDGYHRALEEKNYAYASVCAFMITLTIHATNEVTKDRTEMIESMAATMVLLEAIENAKEAIRGTQHP
jgi:hypothetical protein